MRVTNIGTSTAHLAALQASGARVMEASMALSTGRKIRTVADSPTDTATVLRYNAHSAALATYEKAGQDAKTWLDVTDTTLQSISTAVLSAISTTQSATSPAMDSTSREALAGQLDSLREHLFSLANTKNQGRSIFGGFADEAVAKNPDGSVSFTGDGGAVSRQVSASMQVQVNTDGAEVFGFAGDQDVFAVLEEAAAAIRAGDAEAINASLGKLNAAHENVLTGLEKVGNAGVAVNDALAAAAAQKLTLTTAKSALVDTDIAQATIDAQLAALGHQAVLAAVSQSMMPSLADYLR
jgi:flagellar hook-associated protein 3 FlgL